MVSTPQTLITAEPPSEEVRFVASVTENVSGETPVARVTEESNPGSNVVGQISKVAAKYDVPSTTMYNAALSEGNLKADPPGHNDGGAACGVMQIHADIWGFDCEELKQKPEIGLEFFAKKLKAGEEWKYWTACNCYSFAKVKLRADGMQIPRMADIVPNSNYAPGKIAIFNYTSSDGSIVKHVAYVEGPAEGGFKVSEANKSPCLIGTRVIHWDDPNLVGFWG